MTTEMPIIACLNLAQRAMDANGETLTVTVDTLEDGQHIRINTDAVSLVFPRDDAIKLLIPLLSAIHPGRLDRGAPYDLA